MPVRCAFECALFILCYSIGGAGGQQPADTTDVCVAVIYVFTLFYFAFNLRFTIYRHDSNSSIFW